MVRASFWRQRPVFVTGATGLLGAELTRLLVEQGADVVVLVRDENRKARFFELGLHAKVTCVYGELQDVYLLERVLNEYDIDTVFHLGAQTIVGTALREPLGTFESNIRGTYHLLEACRRVNVAKRIIVASSDKAYGAHSRLPYREEASLKGGFPYDVSKSCADLLATSYFQTYRLPIAVTRCGNFFGPGDLNFNRLIPGTIRSLLQDERPVIRSDGKFVRDYLYVGDGALAYLALAEIMAQKELFGEAFNFSYGKPLSVVAVVKKISELMKATRLKPIIKFEASNEIRKQYLSSLKARKVLGWRPAYDFEQGLIETIDWYRHFFARE